MSPEHWSILWPLLGASMVVTLTELQKRLWVRGYFGYGQLLSGFEYEQPPGWSAVAVKLGIPLLAGAVGSLGSATQAVFAGALVALFGSLALSWPVFLTFDAIPDYLKHRVFELRSLYALSILANAALGAVGGLIAEVFRSLLSSPSLGRWLEGVSVNLASDAIWAFAVLIASTLLARRQANRAYELRSAAERSWHEPQYEDAGADDEVSS